MGDGDDFGKHLKRTPATHNNIYYPFQFHHTVSVNGVYIYYYRKTVNKQAADQNDVYYAS